MIKVKINGIKHHFIAKYFITLIIFFLLIFTEASTGCPIPDLRFSRPKKFGTTTTEQPYVTFESTQIYLPEDLTTSDFEYIEGGGVGGGGGESTADLHEPIGGGGSDSVQRQTRYTDFNPYAWDGAGAAAAGESAHPGGGGHDDDDSLLLSSSAATSHQQHTKHERRKLRKNASGRRRFERPYLQHGKHQSKRDVGATTSNKQTYHHHHHHHKHHLHSYPLSSISSSSLPSIYQNVFSEAAAAAAMVRDEDDHHQQQDDLNVMGMVGDGGSPSVAVHHNVNDDDNDVDKDGNVIVRRSNKKGDLNNSDRKYDKDDDLPADDVHEDNVENDDGNQTSSSSLLTRVKRKSGKTTGALSRPKGASDSGSKSTSRKKDGELMFNVQLFSSFFCIV